MPSEGSCGEVCRLVLMGEHSIHLFLCQELLVVGNTKKLLSAFLFPIEEKDTLCEIIIKWLA